MDEQTKEFLRLCDAALAETERVLDTAVQGTDRDQYLLQTANFLLENLQVLRRHAVEGTLRRPSEGIGFGMTRGVGDWGWIEGTLLMDMMYELEGFYMDHM